MNLELFNKVANEEVEMLANDTSLDRTKMNDKMFNPLHPVYCFLGQLFGWSNAQAYRKKVITKELEAEKWIWKGDKSSATRGSMTPLEIWSADMWIEGAKEPVMEVYEYIKSGGQGNKPIINYQIPQT